MAAPLPENEAERLAALYDHHILDTPPAEEFDSLVRLAAQVCGVPIATVTLVDEHRQWFKAAMGLDITQTPRDISFCARTILQSDMMVVPDAQADPRFADNPLVTGAPHIRFYAAVPLVSEEGHALGALCVIDRTPRQLSAEQESALHLLARQVSSHLKAVRRVAERERLVWEKERLVIEKEHFAAEREQAEAERLRLAAIVETCADAIYSKTLEGQITTWNQGAEALYGYSAAEMIGQHISRLIPPGHSEELNDVMDALRCGAEVTPRETQRLMKSGACVDVSLRVSPILNAQGQIVGASMIAHDITARKQAEASLVQMHRALAESEEGFRTSVDTMEEGLALQDWDGSILFCNESAERILGLSSDQIRGRTSLDPRWRAVREDGTDFPGEQHPAMVALREGIPQRNVIMGIHKPNDELTWVNINAMPMRYTYGENSPQQEKAHRVVTTFSDITERKALEQSLRQSSHAIQESQKAMQAVLESAPIILYAANTEEIITLSEGKGLTALGLKPGEAVGHSLSEFSGGDPETEANTRRVLAGESVAYTMQYGDLWLHTGLRPARDEAGKVTGIIGVCLDVTERMQAEEQIKDHMVILEFQKVELERANAELEALATTDGLTGLKNRRAFQERLAEEISRAARYGTPLSLLLLDVDRFKQFNDSYGHPAGDTVLKSVAEILQSCARDTDLVARYGGEEFVLILPVTDIEGAAAFAERVRAAVEGHSWPLRTVTASFGISALRLGGEGSAEMITRADGALYQSKAAGRNQVTRAADQTAPIAAFCSEPS